jgi:tRNA-specific 2-thiouridylase
MAKVFIMMSGGVDSSVAAADLVDQGHEVVGVFMKCWSIEQLESLGADKSLYGCYWEEDASDARMVAAKLGIPFYVWDFQKEYKQGVVDYMLSEYQSGRTPNPDVMCNSTVKFGIFYQRAMELGADFVATGHYARRVQKAKSKEQSESEVSIHRGNDHNKDQSYFLWRVKREQIQKTLFPIGEYLTKSLVRQRALDLELITADKPDSQGLCFIGDTSLRDLLLQTIGRHEGDILDKNEKVLGKHPGAFLYTIGQRGGLGLSGGPWFVYKVDVAQNQVFVTHEGDEESLLGSSLMASDLNWLVENLENQTEFECEAQIRYRQEATKCKVKIDSNQTEVSFYEPVRAISSGQSIVFYDGDLMLGGGVIS